MRTYVPLLVACSLLAACTETAPAAAPPPVPPTSPTTPVAAANDPEAAQRQLAEKRHAAIQRLTGVQEDETVGQLDYKIISIAEAGPGAMRVNLGVTNGGPATSRGESFDGVAMLDRTGTRYPIASPKPLVLEAGQTTEVTWVFPVRLADADRLDVFGRRVPMLPFRPITLPLKRGNSVISTDESGGQSVPVPVRPMKKGQ